MLILKTLLDPPSLKIRHCVEANIFTGRHADRR